MRIEFEQIDKENINIIGIEGEERREIGCIFTPSGSSENCLNSIQLCGAVQIFNYWGCSRYYQPDGINNPRKSVMCALKGEREGYTQMKDIQIMFEFGTEPARIIDNIKLNKVCLGCYNHPCTCDNKGNHKYLSPYNIKREEELQDVLEYKDGKKPVWYFEDQKVFNE